MAYFLSNQEMNDYIASLLLDYDIYGPVIHEKKGRYSDTDIIIYKKVNSFTEMNFTHKSDYSAKDIMLPLNETLLYFLENDFKKPENTMRETIVFLRPCDLHAVKRTDQIYLDNKYRDVYYHEKRNKIKFAVVGCQTSFENCSCVSFDTNKVNNYDIGINLRNNGYEIDVRDENILAPKADNITFELDFVKENDVKVSLADHINLEDIHSSTIWDEYSTRCIGCGACNFVCPTCTCFTMQDIFYEDNDNAGERKRVMASCMVDGYTDMAGGMSFREDKKDRMRFKVMHKVSDFKERFGYNMCVGCGRCDDVCPELIKFSATVNALTNYVNGGCKNE